MSEPKRRFEALPDADSRRRSIKVVTYNVFADKLATSGWVLRPQSIHRLSQSKGLEVDFDARGSLSATSCMAESDPTQNNKSALGLWPNRTHRRSSHVPDAILNWSSRGANLMTEILSYSADILCLQEVRDGQSK